MISSGAQSELAEQVLAPLMGAGERLLWSGRPRQGIFLQGSDGFLIPFSLMWGGFAIFWEYSVWTSKAPFFFRLWGVPFVLVGLYFMIGRFFADARTRSKTWYGVTSERVIIVSGWLSRNVKSLQLRTLSDLSLSEGSDGMGTITFGPVAPRWSAFSRWSPSRDDVPSFQSIPAAREVFDRIRSAQRQA
jgi:hypothetical protein